MQQILTYIRKNPWKALRRTLFAVCLVVYLVYTGLQLFTVRQYYGVIRAVMEELLLIDGYDVGLDFSDTRIADDTQLQEQICEEMNPLFVRRFNDLFTLHTSIGYDIDIYFHYQGIGKYDLSVYLYTDGAVGVYGYGVTYNPLLLSWRAKYTG